MVWFCFLNAEFGFAKNFKIPWDEDFIILHSFHSALLSKAKLGTERMNGE